MARPGHESRCAYRSDPSHTRVPNGDPQPTTTRDRSLTAEQAYCMNTSSALPNTR